MRFDSKSGAGFWIDILCIDQENEQEKADQVRLQGEIYKSATCVLSWLGPSGDNSDLAMDYLDKCPSIASKSYGPNAFVVHGLDCLLNRPNWTRIWIVQEILLAQKVWILCGSKIVDEFRLSYLTLDPPFECRLLNKSSAGELFKERYLFSQNGPSPLKDLLYNFCGFLLGLCSDPVEKI